MTRYTNKRLQRGYTLIELLLYITVLGSLLMGISLFFVTATSARVKNQTIAEVDRQGTLAMDYITQVIRNGSSITSPAAGSSGSSLTLVVPTSSLSPTVFSMTGGTSTLGYNVAGSTTDAADSGSINATKFVASTSGTVTTLNARVATVPAAPNNQAQMAIYSGTSSPSTLLASSASTTLTANSWNSFTISSVNITAGQTYWLAYNANGLAIGDDDLRYDAGSAGQSEFITQTYGAWPGSWTGTAQNFQFSMYATVTSGTAALQVQEGAASAVPLTNSKVQVSGLNFINLSRSGTPGVVRVSFTISRLNPNSRNEYDYQKTFTATAALRP